MTTIEAGRRRLFADEETLVRCGRVVLGVPAAIICAGLLLTAVTGVIGGILTAAVILGWTQLAGL